VSESCFRSGKSILMDFNLRPYLPADRSSIEGDRLILQIDADEFLERLKVTLHQRVFVAHLVMRLHVCRTVNGTSNGCSNHHR